MCLTNKLNCCSGVSDSGKWILPNQHDVTSMNSTAPIHQLYGNSAILLQRKQETQLVGRIFRCDIMDESGELQSLYISMYQESPPCKSLFIICVCTS
jgi:hypothetical protein